MIFQASFCGTVGRPRQRFPPPIANFNYSRKRLFDSGWYLVEMDQLAMAGCLLTFHCLRTLSFTQHLRVLINLLLMTCGAS
jgi:hypothetical protein